MYQQSAFLRACLRITVRRYAVIAAATLLLPITAIAGGIELNSREYKMMLKPEDLLARRGATSSRTVRKRTARPGSAHAVERQRSRRAGGERAQGGDEPRMRAVFGQPGLPALSARLCLAGARGYRRARRGAKEVELTLKFRSPDAFLAAGMPLKVKEDARQAVEQVQRRIWGLSPFATDRNEVRLPTRVVFAAGLPRSTKQLPYRQQAASQSRPGSASIYRSFEDQLRTRPPVMFRDVGAAEPSPEYREVVYESSKLDLIKDLKARFALTLWYKDADRQGAEPGARPDARSRYKTRNGEVPDEARGGRLLCS